MKHGFVKHGYELLFISDSDVQRVTVQNEQ